MKSILLLLMLGSMAWGQTGMCSGDGCGKPLTADQDLKATQREIAKMEADMRKDMEKSVYPRDVFSIVIDHAKMPIRGWAFKFASRLEFDGSIDYQEYLVTATKRAAPPHYFYVSIKQGEEEDTQQSVYEVRVKELQKPDEDWNHNAFWDEGIWSGERGKSAHWVPGDDGKTGTCSTGSNWLGESWGPATKEECFKLNDPQEK